MEENFLDKWCDKIWLIVLYAVGIVMFVVTVVKWNNWSAPERLMAILTVLLPIHVFEENTFPGGFPYMNNIAAKSTNPMLYPQNKLTNMVTNLGGEMYIILLLLITHLAPKSMAILTAAFGISQLIMHTRCGVIAFQKYKATGKRTIYGTGTISTIALVILSIVSIQWILTQTMAVTDILLGIGIIVSVVVGFILLPLRISAIKRNKRFALTDIGYFEKFQ